LHQVLPRFAFIAPYRLWPARAAGNLSQRAKREAALEAQNTRERIPISIRPGIRTTRRAASWQNAGPVNSPGPSPPPIPESRPDLTPREYGDSGMDVVAIRCLSITWNRKSFALASVAQTTGRRMR